jgi:hypothetical protein
MPSLLKPSEVKTAHRMDIEIKIVLDTRNTYSYFEGLYALYPSMQEFAGCSKYLY